MYQLSQREGLNWFKKVVLVASFQDRYVPFASARLELSPKNTTRHKVKSVIFSEMAINLLQSITINTLFRVDVNFKISKKSVDSVLGRTAHIQLLCNKFLLKILTKNYLM